MKLAKRDLAQLYIGFWKSTLTPDGCIMWTNPQNPVTVFATPDHDETNVVSVDVVPSIDALDDDLVLQTKFSLGGVSAEHDAKTYLANVRQVLNLLK